MQPIMLGRIYGVRIRAEMSALIGSAGLWLFFTLLLLWLAGFEAIAAILGGLLATLLYWIGEVAHQLGHAVAARRTGYPMTGLRLYWILGASEYPADEPTLPAHTHVRRALGGAPASFVYSALLGLVALLTPSGSFVQQVVGLAAVVTVLMFGVGAFAPLPFTDGGTLLRYLGRRAAK